MHMNTTIKDTIGGKFNDLLKLVILGFIAFDFFSPLTFKYIANLFEEAQTRMNLFVAFKILYVTLPVLIYLAYLAFSGRINELKVVSVKSLGNGFNIALGTLLVVTILVSVGISTPIAVAESILVPCVIMGVLCSSFAVGYWQFCKTFNRDEKPPYKNPRTGLIHVGLVLALTLSGIVLLGWLDHTGKPVKACTIYSDPFDSQKDLEKDNKTLKRFYELELDVNRELSKGILFAKTHANDFGFVRNAPGDQTDDSFFKTALADNITFRDTTEAKRAKASVTRLLAELQHKQLSSNDLRNLNRQLEVVPEYVAFVRHALEGTMDKDQKKAMNDARTLLTHVQKVDLLIFPVLIFCLFVVYKIREFADTASETQLRLKTVIIIYVLMFVQMLKPVDPNHINLQDASWPFTYSNWYLPGYIQTIGSVSNETANNDNRVFVEAGIEELRQEIIQLKSQNLQLTENLIVLNNHLADNCLTAGELSNLNRVISNVKDTLNSVSKNVTKVKTNTTINPRVP